MNNSNCYHNYTLYTSNYEFLYCIFYVPTYTQFETVLNFLGWVLNTEIMVCLKKKKTRMRIIITRVHLKYKFIFFNLFVADEFDTIILLKYRWLHLLYRTKSDKIFKIYVYNTSYFKRAT